MSKSKWSGRLTLGVAAVASMLFGALPSSASTSESGDTWAATAAAADARGYVIVDASSAVTTAGGATFYPTGPIADETIVVVAGSGGVLPDGLTATRLAEIAADRGNGLTKAEAAESVTPFAGYPRAYSSTTTVNWSQTFSGASVIGTTSTFRLGYSFNVHWGTAQQNAGQGLGYYRGYMGSVFGTWSQWYGLGFATGNADGGASVPWGNVAAIAKFRAKCGTSTVCGGYWAP